MDGSDVFFRELGSATSNQFENPLKELFLQYTEGEFWWHSVMKVHFVSA